MEITYVRMRIGGKMWHSLKHCLSGTSAPDSESALPPFSRFAARLQLALGDVVLRSTSATQVRRRRRQRTPSDDNYARPPSARQSRTSTSPSLVSLAACCSTARLFWSHDAKCLHKVAQSRPISIPYLQPKGSSKYKYRLQHCLECIMRV